MSGALREPTGHVFRVDRAKGPVWYAKYRLPDGRQVQKLIGPAWADRGRPANGYFTKRTAEAWLHDVLAHARRGTLPGMRSGGATFAEAAAEWIRFIEQDRGRKPNTIRDYTAGLRAYLLPAFGDRELESITRPEIEAWRRTLPVSLSARTKNKLLIELHGIFRRAQVMYGLEANPLSLVEKHPLKASGDIQVFSPEEVWALVRAASSELDAAIFLTASFTGLRLGELLALRWRDVDFAGSVVRVRASYSTGHLTTPKSGKVRSVPMAPDVASALAQLGNREEFMSDDDLVFPGIFGTYLDDSALRRRYKAALTAAGLRQLRFHDLRHTFGTRMIAKADIRRVQEWMGHADIQTTMKYLHYAPHAEDARLVAEAFALPETRDAWGRSGDGRGRSGRSTPTRDIFGQLRATRDNLMPELCRFRGLVILMFADEGIHQIAHFHVRAAGLKASFRLDGTPSPVICRWSSCVSSASGRLCTRPSSRRTGHASVARSCQIGLTRWLKLSA